jgi:transcriptional regulator with XRE-family HTH domain
MDGQEELIKFGNRVREIRLKKGLTQSQLAEAIEQSPGYIEGIEVGTCNIYMTEIGDLARKLETPVSHLFR